MPLFAVQYVYDARDDRRSEVRAEHRAWLGDLADAGTVLGSGPYVGGVPGALLVFRSDDEAALRNLLLEDPFAREGLVAATEVREWDVVIGAWSRDA
ncbi:YciI family protein [Cellulomonas marina]|uniref:YCII-related domain-containing protein n=1 Tax=Cellulomonas marina TaxID=988821 RepID=A0A1I0ZXH7_9CELL|nr:YciI family protein [Cellulomonas marina]GIG29444.1 hypothetical protein Cma02nite_20440 [Cellulomonas marina]SFB30409.1 hypothetical protein SAMN05421867_11384 [Cellulomonas marina]